MVNSDQLSVDYIERVERTNRKLVSLLAALTDMWGRSSRAGKLEERSNLDAAEFLNEYYLQNRAVILRGGAAHWPALERWTLERLKSNFGAVEIEYLETHDRYLDLEANIRRCTLRDFIERIETTTFSNDFYAVGKNHLLRNTSLSALIDDVAPLSLSPNLQFSDTDSVRLWISPRGAITPLHHDLNNVLFIQILGSKEFLLAPSFAWPLMRNTSSVFSDMDPILERLEGNTFPWARVVVHPGDVVFIPLGWWHWVYSETPSISLNVARFEMFENPISWENAQL